MKLTLEFENTEEALSFLNMYAKEVAFREYFVELGRQMVREMAQKPTTVRLKKKAK